MAKSSPAKKVTITSKVPPRFKTRLEQIAEEKSTSISSLIHQLLVQALDTEKLLEEIKRELEISREENRQLSSVLVANIHRSKPVAKEDIPLMIQDSVVYAHDIVSQREC